MEKEKITGLFEEDGRMLTPRALEAIMKSQDPLEKAKQVLRNVEKDIIEPSDVSAFSVRKKKFPHELEYVVVSENSIDGKSTSSGDISDFYKLFRDRYERLGEILRQRGQSVLPFSVVKENPNPSRVIGIVTDKRESTKGHRLFKLEDMEDALTVLVPKSDERLLKSTEKIILDQVVAVDGTYRNGLFIANSVLEPDVPLHHARKSKREIWVALLSDVHLGSTFFMEKCFERFIRWINQEHGGEQQMEVASKLGYVTLCGDLVDGIGVYPRQEEELVTKDIYEQYDQLGKYLEQFPGHVQVFACPGNHDAVRLAEPQPSIPRHYAERMWELDNVHMLPNPASLVLEGVRFLLYHGMSIDTMIAAVPGLNYHSIEPVLEQYLKKRHLSVVYGEKPLALEERDMMVIDPVPDVFHIGHVHKNAYTRYNGVVAINSGTWQSTTPYQEKQGHVPTPCQLPLLNLKTLEVKVINFSDKKPEAS